jgi:transcriptional regulator with XRE-family HTH domain
MGIISSLRILFILEFSSYGKLDIINENIKYIRLHYKLTQSEFAEKLEVTRDSISKYETKSIPKPEFLRLLSSKFNINLHNLFITRINEKNFELFKLNQENLTTVLDLKSDYKDFDKITAKDIKLFDTQIKEKIRFLKERDLNQNDRSILLDELNKYQEILIRKLVEFYDKQSQLFDYLTERGILPKE